MCCAVVQLNMQQQLLCNYCKYSSVADCKVCTVNVLCCKSLNITVTVSVCKQQSAAIYIDIDCVTVWVSSRKKATTMRLLLFAYLSVRPSAFET